MQTSAIRACSYIAERNLSYEKIMQTSAMRACSYIAERSLSYYNHKTIKQCIHT